MSNFELLYERAHQAGLDAATKTKVQPMIVGQAKSLFSGQIDETKPTYFVEDGLCGFAEIVVKPGNSRFANWLKKQKIAQKRYSGSGVSIWVSEFGQSYQRKIEYARAFAAVLRDEDINAMPMGRLD
jgi:hypothetical protein